MHLDEDGWQHMSILNIMGKYTNAFLRTDANTLISDPRVPQLGESTPIGGGIHTHMQKYSDR